MKPKDLLFPFIETEKKVFLDPSNRIFYVPSRLDPVQRPAFWTELLLSSPFSHLEIGSGNGEWICEKAQQEPEKLWLALEMRFDRVRKIWSKMKNHQISNLWILCGRAEDFFSYYFPKHSLDHVSINFPDPWPKKRHAKNRLIQSPFLSPLFQTLKDEGVVDLLTDDLDYHLQMKEVFDHCDLFQKQSELKSLPNDFESYGSSYFMRLWQEKERNFYFLKYKNSVHNKILALT